MPLTDVAVRGAKADEFQRLAVEEYLQRFADDIEARVSAKIGTGC